MPASGLPVDRGHAGNCSRTRSLRRGSFGAAVAPTKLPQRPDASVINETIPLFYIGRNKAGRWVAREAHGRSGGLFLFRRSALRFAREESEPVGCAMMFLSDPLELDVASQPDRTVLPFAAPRRPPRFAVACVAAAVAAGRQLVARLPRVFASPRLHRETIERK
jgi:hypothetical protein